MVLFLTCVSPSLADSDPDPGTQGDDILLVPDEYERKVDGTYQITSELLLSTADWLDSFFGDDRYIFEENTTHVKLRLSCGYSRFNGFDFSPRVSLQLKLPQLSKKASKLVIGNAFSGTG